MLESHPMKAREPEPGAAVPAKTCRRSYGPVCENAYAAPQLASRRALARGIGTAVYDPGGHGADRRTGPATRRSLCRILMISGLCLLASVATALPAAASSPAKALARTQLLRAELELLRYESGKSLVGQPAVSISGVKDYHAAWLAEALFDKVDRLCFEFTSRRSAPVRNSLAGFSRVEALLDSSLECLGRVKESLGVYETSSEPPPNRAATPDKLAMEILQAGRQTDLLLADKFDESETFDVVTGAVGIAAALAALHPGLRRIAEEPELERYKRPVDVFLKTLDVQDHLSALATPGAIAEFAFTGDTSSPDALSMVDAYDSSRLLRAELEALARDRKAQSSRAPLFRSGPKLPSQVFQRLGLLERQLQQLTEAESLPATHKTPTATEAVAP